MLHPRDEEGLWQQTMAARPTPQKFGHRTFPNGRIRDGAPVSLYPVPATLRPSTKRAPALARTGASSRTPRTLTPRLPRPTRRYLSIPPSPSNQARMPSCHRVKIPNTCHARCACVTALPLVWSWRAGSSRGHARSACPRRRTNPGTPGAPPPRRRRRRTEILRCLLRRPRRRLRAAASCAIPSWSSAPSPCAAGTPTTSVEPCSRRGIGRG